MLISSNYHSGCLVTKLVSDASRSFLTMTILMLKRIIFSIHPSGGVVVIPRPFSPPEPPKAHLAKKIELLSQRSALMHLFPFSLNS